MSEFGLKIWHKNVEFEKKNSRKYFFLDLIILSLTINLHLRLN